MSEKIPNKLIKNIIKLVKKVTEETEVTIVSFSDDLDVPEQENIEELTEELGLQEEETTCCYKDVYCTFNTYISIFEGRVLEIKVIDSNYSYKLKINDFGDI